MEKFIRLKVVVHKKTATFFVVGKIGQNFDEKSECLYGIFDV